jgi:hypothetical protein
MEADMPKLKLPEFLDEKPVKVTVELPAKLHRDLSAYAQVLGRQTGSPITDPIRLIAPMLERFIATDREFAKARRRSEEPTGNTATSVHCQDGPASERG